MDDLRAVCCLRTAACCTRKALKSSSSRAMSPRKAAGEKKKPEAELILLPWAAPTVRTALTLAILIPQYQMRKPEEQIGF